MDEFTDDVPHVVMNFISQVTHEQVIRLSEEIGPVCLIAEEKTPPLGAKTSFTFSS